MLPILRFFELLHHRQPERGGLGLLDPNAEHAFALIRQRRWRETGFATHMRASHCVMTLPLATSKAANNVVVP